MNPDQPFHAGELRIQEQLGERDEAQRNGRAISDRIVRGAFRFVEQQPFVVVASLGPDGSGRPERPWASILPGVPGFARVPHDRRVELDLGATVRHEADPMLANLERDPRLGMLFIEPGSRRRLRINGRALREGDTLVVDVDEAFPNCPKYIQRRALRSEVDSSPAGSLACDSGTSLGEGEREHVRRSDTLFLASAHPAESLDASHRGGAPGSVAVEDERTLRIPDYPGNHMYNTLGNLALNPWAGMTFLDFESGRVLMTTGRAGALETLAGNEDVTGGTNRFWTFTVERWVAFELPVRWAWEFLDASPFNPPVSSSDS